MSARQERFTDFMMEAAYVADVSGAAEFSPDPLKPSLDPVDCSPRIISSGILEWVDKAIYKTEAFIAASRAGEYKDPPKELVIKTPSNEYAFDVPVNNSKIRHFTVRDTFDPKHSLRVTLAPSLVEVKEEINGDTVSLFGSDAALWVAIGAVNRFIQSSQNIRSIPASV